MPILRSAQFSAIALFGAAVLGLVVANSPAGVSVIAFSHDKLGFLSLEHWVTDGLLAIFFFLASLELKHELVAGELNSPRKALVPAIAAVGGVIAPAAIYLLAVREQPMAGGWPIPTATDIAFALGVLALVGKWLPARVRALLLALAVIDDLIAILIIAFFFTTGLQPLPLVGAVPVVLLFGLLTYRKPTPVIAIALVILGVGAWVLVAMSGIHPTIAGVALGLVFASKNSGRVRHAIEPWTNAMILPIFAFVATLVVIPDLSATPLGPVFWVIVIALPVGKLIGITAGGLVAGLISPRDRPPIADLIVVAALGGIGFTVSLLMNELAFEAEPSLATEGTLGVLVASVIAIAIGGTVGALRSRHYKKQSA